MNRIYLAFGVHNHQPVGNFDLVFDTACRKCYFPYLQLLADNPQFRSSIHFSGVLLDWILDHHPHIAEVIKTLVDRNQVELLTGAHYEPILSAIPDRDKIGQILKYSGVLRERFGVRPRGMWLAERVWEPHLAAPIAKAGVEYTVLDDTHFKYSGLAEDQLYGHYVTEEEGHTLSLLPISRRLRYLIPFARPSETIDYLQQVAEQHPHAVVVYADDGEKFGIWPETHELVWEKGWLKSFVAELDKHTDWLTVIPLGEALRRLPPLGQVYLPTASYAEMSEWALPAPAGRDFEDFLEKLHTSGDEERYGIFARGGFWRNFLVKYPESNQMHKRMLSISEKIDRWAKRTIPENPALQAAYDHLWQAQCNCAYWHGVFGGLYLPHLRAAVWQHLIAADRQVNEALAEKSSYASARKSDLDTDGRDEVLFATDRMFLCIKPAAGGSVVEYDVFDKGINLIDGLSRREETYHRRLAGAVYKPAGEKAAEGTVSIHDRFTAKEQNLERYINYDWYRRASFLDHFFGDSADIDGFAQNRYPEQGDFVNQAYAAEVESSGKVIRAALRRRGGVWIGPDHIPVEVEKIFRAEAGSPLLTISYRVTNLGDKPFAIRFGVEFCAALQSDQRPGTMMRFDHGEDGSRLDAMGTRISHRRWEVVDKQTDLLIAVETDRPAEWWYFPLYTVSLSEDGFERSYQCTIACAVWPLSLAPGAAWTTAITHYAGTRDGEQAIRSAVSSRLREAEPVVEPI